MKTYKRSHEPLAWSLFGAGGMVVAFILPMLVLMTGFVFVPDASLRVYGLMEAWLSDWVGKTLLFLIISLTLYHTVHRIFHGLHDLHFGGNPRVMSLVFYGAATALSIVCAAWLLVI